MLESLVKLDQQITLAFNGSESSIMDSIMMTITTTATWIPLGLVILYFIYKRLGLRNFLFVLGGIALCILLADRVASGIVKPLVERYRPSQEPELYGMVDLVNGYRGGRYGFFSSHAANTMSVAVFLSMIFKRKYLICLFVSWSLLNCWSRVYLGVHYVGDILVGIIWGVIVGFVVYKIYSHYCHQDKIEEPRLIGWSVLATYLAILVLAPFLAAW